METRERLIDRLTVNPSECGELLGLSRPTVYDLLRRRDGIPSFKIGTRTLIPIDGLRVWIAQQTGGEQNEQ